MRNNFCKTPLWECNDELVRVAQGEKPAELVIRHANLVNVATHEILPDVDIAVVCGRVAYLGLGGHTAEHCIGAGTQVMDATGLFAAPGFMDSHIHVESAMIGVAEYARAVVPHGTTGIFCERSTPAPSCPTGPPASSATPTRSATSPAWRVCARCSRTRGACPSRP